jgi:uncharacterized integral membrane protein
MPPKSKSRIDNVVCSISPTLWRVIFVAVIILIALFLFCCYNQNAKEMVSVIWNKYVEKLSIVGLLLIIMRMIYDIKDILQFFREKL